MFLKAYIVITFNVSLLSCCIDIVLMNKEAFKEKVFKEVYENHWLKLYLHLLKMVDDEDDAKDIVQEVFTNLWNNFDSVGITTSYSSYLYSSVRNRAINYLAHKKIILEHEKNSETQTVSLNSIGPDVFLIEKELAQQINNEIDNLPPKMAAIFKMSRFENKSYKEIAEELEIAENTVKKQISRALSLMREKFLHIKYYILFL